MPTKKTKSSPAVGSDGGAVATVVALTGWSTDAASLALSRYQYRVNDCVDAILAGDEKPSQGWTAVRKEKGGTKEAEVRRSSAKQDPPRPENLALGRGRGRGRGRGTIRPTVRLTTQPSTAPSTAKAPAGRPQGRAAAPRSTNHQPPTHQPTVAQVPVQPTAAELTQSPQQVALQAIAEGRQPPPTKTTGPPSFADVVRAKEAARLAARASLSTGTVGVDPLPGRERGEEEAAAANAATAERKSRGKRGGKGRGRGALANGPGSADQAEEVTVNEQQQQQQQQDEEKQQQQQQVREADVQPKQVDTPSEGQQQQQQQQQQQVSSEVPSSTSASSSVAGASSSSSAVAPSDGTFSMPLTLPGVPSEHFDDAIQFGSFGQADAAVPATVPPTVAPVAAQPAEVAHGYAAAPGGGAASATGQAPLDEAYQNLLAQQMFYQRRMQEQSDAFQQYMYQQQGGGAAGAPAQGQAPSPPFLMRQQWSGTTHADGPAGQAAGQWAGPARSYPAGHARAAPAPYLYQPEYDMRYAPAPMSMYSDPPQQHSSSPPPPLGRDGADRAPLYQGAVDPSYMAMYGVMTPGMSLGAEQPLASTAQSFGGRPPAGQAQGGPAPPGLPPPPMSDMSHMYGGVPPQSAGYPPYYSANQYGGAPPPLAGGEYETPGYTKPKGPRHAGRGGANAYQQQHHHQQQQQQQQQHHHQQYQQQYQQQAHPQHQQHRAPPRR